MAKQDVLRLDVPVDHALRVGVVERFRRVTGEPQRLGEGERTLASNPLAQRPA